MITPSYVRTMATYNAEMNRRVFGAALRIPDEERRADRGVFWTSIHGTLCHLLWADRTWLSRFGVGERPRRASAAATGSWPPLTTFGRNARTPTARSSAGPRG